MIEIRLAEDKDWVEIWPIVREVFQSGTTYAYSPETNKKMGLVDAHIMYRLLDE